ncbi:MAG TPA: lysylphosphatidylglycerol synthase domain-containing protein, partial [Anaerolineae bacterium]|nr:lysylphosphatidylglycerol synthase domain-containing protein [Anaerolineae bacterium]
MIKRHKTLLRVITVILLIALVLFFKIDLNETLVLLGNANVWLVTLAVLGFIPFLLLKAWRWQIVLRDLGIAIPFREAVRLYALGLGAGMI